MLAWSTPTTAPTPRTCTGLVCSCRNLGRVLRHIREGVARHASMVDLNKARGLSAAAATSTRHSTTSARAPHAMIRTNGMLASSAVRHFMLRHGRQRRPPKHGLGEASGT
uniref:Uncharacterized protein n=1 Tax=Oryza sativa subsp. japonica TaxID=39947 RepID=Q656K2_ORYSJ|nr:hypothetical protein [Oryza sativa Japonica Group]